MKLIFRYVRRYAGAVVFVIIIKLMAAFTELSLPYILEHMIDHVVPSGDAGAIWLWGLGMIAAAAATWQLNYRANRRAVNNAHNVSYDVRRDLFRKTIHLSGRQFDTFTLPSLTSRMTSDSYNVQNFVRASQTLCVRAPIMLLGGITVTMTMDPVLSAILIALVPVLMAVVVTISRKGIPMYEQVQKRLDDVIRTMRENIAGVRVIKALSKEPYERRRFHKASQDMADTDIRTGTFMAIPGPFMQLSLNTGLTLVVLVGAWRVNAGVMKPGVILAFLTYFNLILQSIMAINRMFMMISKASASADRIDAVLQAPEDLETVPNLPEREDLPFISFSHVNFRYDSAQEDTDFGGEDQERVLSDISFTLNRGESLGIIGPTGCGKTTILNLLMRFYDADSGEIYIDGRDVRSYGKEELHSKFGVVFQNDIVFNDTLENNISFGRKLTLPQVRLAAEHAMAAPFIDELEEGLQHEAAIKGANLSGGQKQRLLISRALAGDPEILILDDASSALDYRTDAQLRQAVFAHHSHAAVIMVAQRVSSVKNMTNILVLDNGRCIGCGPHEQLMETCPEYKSIYDAQMGDLE